MYFESLWHESCVGFTLQDQFKSSVLRETDLKLIMSVLHTRFVIVLLLLAQFTYSLSAPQPNTPPPAP